MFQMRYSNRQSTMTSTNRIKCVLALLAVSLLSFVPYNGTFCFGQSSSPSLSPSVSLAAPILKLKNTESTDSSKKEQSPETSSNIGKKVPVLYGIDGNNKKQKMTIDKLESGKKVQGTIIIFFSLECPVSNSYMSTIDDMSKKYASKGLNFVGVCPECDSLAELKKQMKEFKVSFPLFLDPGREITTTLEATTTPEAFLLDSERIVRYRGRIDNSYSERLKRNPRTTEFDLQNAITNLLSNQPIRITKTIPVGCPITSISSTGTKVETKSGLTFYRDIEPILQNRCQSCHRPGAVGPFSLLTYKQSKKWAEDIKNYTHERKMPPWKPVAGQEFLNDRRMTDQEIKKIADWVNDGTPEGDRKDAPPEKVYSDGWQLGKPDLILTPNEDFELAATGKDIFRCFVLPTGLTEDKYIVGFETRPGNSRIVHHTLNFWDLTDRAESMELGSRDKKNEFGDHGPGYSVSMGIGFLPGLADLKKSQERGVPPIGAFGGWAPGQMPRFLPEEAGYLLPKGAKVVVQVHYHRNGKVERDRLQIGLYFAKKPVVNKWRTIVVDGFPKIASKFPFYSYIPAGDAHYVTRGTIWLSADATIYNVMPHMHLLGKSVKVSMTLPGKESTLLLQIDDWDYNWQETYWFKNPIAVPKGTKFEVEAVYDNSSKNPNNPRNPPTQVRSGDETTDEMLFGFLGCLPKQKNGPLRFLRTPPKDEPSPKQSNTP